MKILNRYIDELVLKTNGNTLQYADLRGTNLHGTNIQDAYLQGAIR